MPLSDQGSIRQPWKRYTKAECIGRGASKVVYKAFDEVEGIEVAWNEVLCSDACLGSVKERSRMMGEITMLRQLKHRNIMRLFDWWYDKEHQVLVFITELLTDGSLRRFIRRKHAAGKGITLGVIKRYAWQILQGLVYLHGHYPPIIHRDLKCDNIFVNGASGELKLGDLGFATMLRGISCPLSVIGTPEFMAPELYDEHYDDKVDIYSYGMCLLELATLEYPYSECTNPAQIYRKVTKGIPPAALAKVENEALREIITLTINPDPNKRPEARQLLVHPFFADVVQAMRTKAWAKGASPRAAAASAAQQQLLVAPEALSSTIAAAGRVPLSAPDAIAAVALDGGNSIRKEQQHQVGSNSTWPAAAVADGLLQLKQSDNTGNGLAAAAADMAGSWQKAGISCGPEFLQAARGNGDVALQPDQQHKANGSTSSATFTSPQQKRTQNEPKQQQLLLVPELSVMPSLTSSIGSYPEVRTSSLTWPQLSINTTAAPGAPMSSGSVTTPLHSPFEAASQSSFNSCLSFGGKSNASACSRTAAAARPVVAVAAGQHPLLAGRGHEASLDEMSEEDVLFESDSQGTHTDEYAGDHDEAAAASIHDTWISVHKQQQLPRQRSSLDTIREDDVDCVCRQIDQQQLSFNVGFCNMKGMRKRIGFQYNAAEDTVDDIAVEMLESLSLMPQQANAIAEKIRAALEALGLPHNGRGTPPPSSSSAAATASNSASTSDGVAGAPMQLAGESVALAIVSTAAASAAIESCNGTPLPGSMDGAAVNNMLQNNITSMLHNGVSNYDIPEGTPGVASARSSSLTRILESNDVIDSIGASPVGSNSTNHGHSTPAAAVAGALCRSISPGIDHASGAMSLQQQQQAAVVCPQQLVHELSLLDRESGAALLHNLQEELWVQSLARPEAAAAVGVELGVTLTGT